MENIYIYDYKKRDKDIGHYTFVDGQIILKKSDATVVISADANDLRYYNYGVQAIWSISIALPFAHIQKTLKRTDDTDFSKVETYINTKLKKYGFNTIDILKDAKQVGVSPVVIKSIALKNKGRDK